MMGVAKYFILSIFYLALLATSDVDVHKPAANNGMMWIGVKNCYIAWQHLANNSCVGFGDYKDDYFLICHKNENLVLKLILAASQQQLLQIPLQTNSGKIIRMDNISYLTFNENPLRPWFLQDINKRGGGTALMDLLDYVGNPTRRGRHSAASIVMTKVPKTPMESWIWNNILFKDKGF